MGQPAARVGDITSHGTPLGPGPGCLTVLIGSMPAWRAAIDTHACPLVDGVKPHVGGVVAVGSTTVLIGGECRPRAQATALSRPGGAQQHRAWRVQRAHRLRPWIPCERKDFLGRGWAMPVALDPRTGQVAEDAVRRIHPPVDPHHHRDCAGRARDAPGLRLRYPRAGVRAHGRPKRCSACAR